MKYPVCMYFKETAPPEEGKRKWKTLSRTPTPGKLFIEEARKRQEKYRVGNDPNAHAPRPGLGSRQIF